MLSAEALADLAGPTLHDARSQGIEGGEPIGTEGPSIIETPEQAIELTVLLGADRNLRASEVHEQACDHTRPASAHAHEVPGERWPEPVVETAADPLAEGP